MTRIEKKDRFNSIFNSTPYGKIGDFLELITNRCGVSRNIIWNWQNGRSEIPDLAMKEIEEIHKNL